MKIANYFKNKVVAGLSVIVTLFTIVAGIWTFNDHYASNKRVNFIEVAYAEDMKKVGQQLSKALENTQHKLDARYFQFLYDQYSQDAMDMRREMRRYPDDKFLREDYEDIIEKKKRVKIKLEKSLEKIKVE